MYLISLYFDAVTEGRIKSYIKEIAKKTGNDAMLSGNIPPHITVSAFHSYKEETALSIFRNITKEINAGTVYPVSVGAFLPRVLFVEPVLNAYLQNVITDIYKEVTKWEGVVPDERYCPFGWMPHITIGKNLTEDQMQKAFCAMQTSFAPFKGTVIRVGLAKTNPYTNIETFVLK